ncbi:hypothetical protein BDV97DRAFT_353797 [Delphinella strobiligena]|nr:hypothetical protein BDV97DRAFT_353797 [Delphinella strobiligena]
MEYDIFTTLNADRRHLTRDRPSKDSDPLARVFTYRSSSSRYGPVMSVAALTGHSISLDNGTVEAAFVQNCEQIKDTEARLLAMSHERGRYSSLEDFQSCDRAAVSGDKHSSGDAVSQTLR